MQNSNVPGWDFLINDIGSMDRAIRSSKAKIYIDSADYFAACLVSGAESISQIILEDDRVKEKWGEGSVAKARGLLDVWAASTLYLKWINTMELDDRDLEVVGGAFGSFHYSDEDGKKARRTRTLINELQHFSTLFNRRRHEGINLEWQVLLSLRTFRALEDNGVPPELDLTSLDPIGSEWASVFWDPERIAPYADEESFRELTRVDRITAMGDIFRIGLILTEETYDRVRKGRRSVWNKFKDRFKRAT